MVPSDRCPYPRPFVDRFDDCPAYQPIRQHPLDSRHRPLAPIWACAHLEAGLSEKARHYARCRVGNEEQRVQWAAQFRGDRVARWRDLARGIGSALEPAIADLYRAKEAQVAATEPAARADADGRLQEAVDRFLEENRRLMEAQSEELLAIGFPVEPVMSLTREAMGALLQRRTVLGSWQPPDAMLEPFEPELRQFLKGLFGATAAGE